MKKRIKLIIRLTALALILIACISNPTSFAINKTLQPTITVAGWDIQGKYYNGLNLSTISSRASAYLVSDGGYVVFQSDDGGNSTSWYPTTVVSANQTSKIADDLQTRFRINTGFGFGNNNGYNGYISFAWTSNQIKTIPQSLNSLKLSSGSTSGLGTCEDYDGIFISLFPSPTGADIGTRNVRCINIWVLSSGKTTYTYSADFTNLTGGPVSLYNEALSSLYETTLSIESKSSTHYGVYLNGIEISTIPKNKVSLQTGYLAFGICGAYTLSQNNFTILEMNGYNAVSYANAYKAIDLMEQIPPPGFVRTSDAAAVSAAKTAYNVLSAEQKSKVPSNLINNLNSAVDFLNIP